MRGEEERVTKVYDFVKYAIDAFFDLFCAAAHTMNDQGNWMYLQDLIERETRLVDVVVVCVRHRERAARFFSTFSL